MPRQVDLYSQNLKVAHDPTKQLSMSGDQVKAMQAELPALIAQAFQQAVTQILQEIDALTGLNLVAWANLLKGNTASGTDLLTQFTNDVNEALGNWQQLFNQTGEDITSFLAYLSSIGTAANHALALVEDFLQTGDWSDLSQAFNELIETLVGGGSATGVFGSIPSTAVTNVNQNFQPVPDFPDAVSLQAGSGWSWDGTTSYGGAGGSAMFTATGLLGALRGVVVAVQPGQVVTPSAQVRWTGLSAATGTHPIQLQLIPYSGPTDAPIAGAPAVIAQVTSPGASSTTYTGQVSGWVQLTSSYTVPSTGVTAVQMRLVVTSDATAGTVWWASGTEKVTGGFLDVMQDDVAALKSDAAAANAATQTFIQAVLYEIQHYTSWTTFITNVEVEYQTWVTTESGLASNEIFTLQQMLNSLFGINSSGLIAPGNVQSSTGAGSLQADWTNWATSITAFWNNLFGTTGANPASAQVAATSVGSSTGSSSLHADVTAVSSTASGAASAASAAQSTANTNATNLTNTWSWLTGTSTAPTSSSKVQTGAVTGLNTAFSTLFGTTTPSSSSQLTSSVLPNITASMSSDLTGVLNAIGNALGLGSTGNTVSSISTPLVQVLGPSAFRAYCSHGSNTFAVGSSPTGTQAFPLTLDTTSYNTGGYGWTSSSNSLTIQQKGLYIIKIGLAAQVSLTNSGYKVIAPILYQNGNVTRYGAGPPLIGNSSNPSPQCWIADSFTVECNAGDVVNPGIYYYYSPTAYSTVFSGESTGAQTYFEVTLVRADH